ncbi:hypothetical protein GCM10010129_83210 [Streptomyces fumigatiscleroticus]|nr:hypothetical protein GCM10010129_83210 [Streptomyces fumigatiscleroticus]
MCRRGDPTGSRIRAPIASPLLHERVFQRDGAQAPDTGRPSSACWTAAAEGLSPSAGTACVSPAGPAVTGKAISRPTFGGRTPVVLGGRYVLNARRPAVRGRP